MADRIHKIPASLDRSYWDHEITLSQSVPGAKLIPLKIIAWVGLMIVLTLYALVGSFIADAGLITKFFFLLWMIIATVFFAQPLKTKEMKFGLIPAALSYAPIAQRRVITRKSSKPNGLYNIVGIREIDDSGLIEFTDNTYGRAFSVVGSASMLLFSEDRNRVVDRVANFWRRVSVNSEYIWLTTKEPQRTHHQLAAFQSQMNNLKSNDPDLKDLLDEKCKVMIDFVGDRFKSTHQYLIIKSDSIEELRSSVNMLASEVESSSLMFSKCVRLEYKEVIDMFKTFYTGRGDFDVKHARPRHTKRREVIMRGEKTAAQYSSSSVA